MSEPKAGRRHTREHSRPGPPAPSMHTPEPLARRSLGPAPPPSPAAPTLAPRVPATPCLALLTVPTSRSSWNLLVQLRTPLSQGRHPSQHAFLFPVPSDPNFWEEGRKRKPHSASPKVPANLTGPTASSRRVWKLGEAPSPGNHPTQCPACSWARRLSSTIKPPRAPDGKWGSRTVVPTQTPSSLSVKPKLWSVLRFKTSSACPSHPSSPSAMSSLLHHTRSDPFPQSCPTRFSGAPSVLPLSVWLRWYLL